jgi:hypothetical protein
MFNDEGNLGFNFDKVSHRYVIIISVFSSIKTSKNDEKNRYGRSKGTIVLRPEELELETKTLPESLSPAMPMTTALLSKAAVTTSFSLWVSSSKHLNVLVTTLFSYNSNLGCSLELTSNMSSSAAFRHKWNGTLLFGKEAQIEP